MNHEYEISNPDAIFGVYAGEDMFLAIGEFCHDAGLELPNNEFAQYGDDDDCRFEWGNRLPDGEKPHYCVAVDFEQQFEHCIFVRKVETAPRAEFIVHDHKSGEDILKGIMLNSGEVRYDADFDQYVFYYGSKSHWERFAESLGLIEAIRADLASRDVDCEEGLHEATRGLRDLEDVVAASFAYLTEVVVDTDMRRSPTESSDVYDSAGYAAVDSVWEHNGFSLEITYYFDDDVTDNIEDAGDWPYDEEHIVEYALRDSNGDDVYVNEDKLDMFGKPLPSFK